MPSLSARIPISLDHRVPTYPTDTHDPQPNLRARTQHEITSDTKHSLTDKHRTALSSFPVRAEVRSPFSLGTVAKCVIRSSEDEKSNYALEPDMGPWILVRCFLSSGS